MEPKTPTASSLKLRTHYYREEEYDYLNMGTDWDFSMARKGKRQSPIDIPFAVKAEGEGYDEEEELKNFEVVLGTTFLDTQIVNEHLNFIIPIPEGAFRINIDDIEGNLKEFHAIHYYYHASSEHLLQGKRYDAELTLVTRMTDYDKNEKMTRAHFSILFTTDEKAGVKGLENLFDPITKYPRPFQAPVEELAKFLAGHAKFFAYTGSNTLPPCKENVNWYVVTQPAYISPESLALLNELFGNPEFYSKIGNARATFPLNDRPVKVLKSKSFDEEQALSNLPDLTFNADRMRSFSVDTNQTVKKLHVEYYESAEWDFTKQGDDWSGDLCRSCLRQSPIDLPYHIVPKSVAHPDEKTIGTLKAIVHDPNLMSTITRRHLGFGISIPPETGFIEIEGPSGSIKHYEMQEYHFHADSEHTFKGQKLDAELHVVTRQTNKKDSHKETRAVFGILLTSDKTLGTEGIENVYESIKTYPASFKNPITEIANFINKNGRFFCYKGSLTTPPCSENVNWHVLTQPAYGKKEDLKVLRDIYSNNRLFSEHGSARRTQPLNDRQIKVLRSKDF